MRRFAKLALALAVLLVGTEARAAYTITFAQSGNDVVATGSGSLNITGLTLEGVGTIVTFVAPTSGSVVIGTDQAVADLYVAFLSGPASFGPGLGAIPTSGSAGPVGYFTQSNFLEVPTGYASGSAISATSTFANRSIAGLGLAPGTYVYSYSATAGGTILDTITVRINAVPEPASMAMVGLGLAGVGLAVRFRR